MKAGVVFWCFGSLKFDSCEIVTCEVFCDPKNNI